MISVVSFSRQESCSFVNHETDHDYADYRTIMLKITICAVGQKFTTLTSGACTGDVLDVASDEIRNNQLCVHKYLFSYNAILPTRKPIIRERVIACLCNINLLNKGCAKNIGLVTKANFTGVISIFLFMSALNRKFLHSL